MAAEENHVTGERGVRDAKHFLECSTYVNVTFTVYDDQAQTTVTGLGTVRKVFDMTGVFLGENARPFFAEVKNYNSVGGQPAEYTEFLAIAYSVTADALSKELDRRTEFIWATWHPFSQSKWAKLTTEAEIREALKEHPEKLAGNPIDDAVVRLVSGRLWLVPLHRRQDELLMTREELLTVYGALGRKGIA